MADQKFKSKVRLQGGAALPAETASRALTLDSSGNIASSAVTDTELGHLSGVTSSVQTQINDAQTDATDALADIADHIALGTDAHDASAISIADANTQFTSTNVEGALDEAMDAAQAAQADATQALSDAADAQADVDDLVSLSGVAANSVNLGTFTGDTIPDSQTIKQAIQALESALEAIPSPFFYAGVWAASTNTPTLADGAGTAGAVYYVTDAGTVDFGAGDQVFAAGDKVAYNGTTWDKWDMTDAVSSVNSQTGAVVLEADDISLASGYTAAAGTVSAADTVQSALQKIDANANAAQQDITDHINDATGAHAGSAISIAPVGILAAGTAQDTVAEIEGYLDDHGTRLNNLNTLTGVAGSASDLGTFTGAIIADNSDIKSALQSLETAVEGFSVGSAGDIDETSFAIANNQAVAASVTGFAFSNTTVRSFKALVSVEIDATLDLFETFEMVGINKAGVFEMSQSGVGDESGIVFTITAGGQVQYTSATYAGFVSGSIKFRAITTTI